VDVTMRKSPRERAQIAQILRLGRCTHPESALCLILTSDWIYDGGFIEYCTACGKVTETYN
jgi:hypothetical protein